MSDEIQTAAMNAAKVWYDSDKTLSEFSSVAWLQTIDTGELLVYTRGEHADEIKKFISEL